jgi:hypothetical protein
VHETTKKIFHEFYFITHSASVSGLGGSFFSKKGKIIVPLYVQPFWRNFFTFYTVFLEKKRKAEKKYPFLNRNRKMTRGLWAMHIYVLARTF